LEDGDQSDADFSHAMELLGRHGAIDATLVRAGQFVRQAQESLSLFPPSALRQALIDVGTYTISRAH
jgi:octaprenyl-diphosphate synthase